MSRSYSGALMNFTGMESFHIYYITVQTSQIHLFYALEWILMHLFFVITFQITSLHVTPSLQLSVQVKDLFNLLRNLDLLEIRTKVRKEEQNKETTQNHSCSKSLNTQRAAFAPLTKINGYHTFQLPSSGRRQVLRRAEILFLHRQK